MLTTFSHNLSLSNQKKSERLAALRPLQNVLTHDNGALSQIIDTNACNLESPTLVHFLQRNVAPYMLNFLPAFSLPHHILAVLKF